MPKVVHGVVHGKVIELSEDLGLAEGQRVEVAVKVVDEETWGTGIRCTAGALTEDPHCEQIMQDVYSVRKQERLSQFSE